MKSDRINQHVSDRGLNFISHVYDFPKNRSALISLVYFTAS